MTELQLRTIVKTVTWRTYTTCVGMITAYILYAPAPSGLFFIHFNDLLSSQ